MTLISLGTREWSRRRLLVQVHLPYSAGVVAIALVGALLTPAAVDAPVVVLAVCLFAATNVALLALPWRGTPVRWQVALAAADIAALALLQLGLHDALPAIGFFCLVPTIWLAYSAPLRAIGLTVPGAAVIAAAPYATTATLPSDAPEWSLAVLLPLLTAVVHSVVLVVMRELTARQQQLERSAAQLRTALAENERRRVLKRAVVENVASGVCFVTDAGEMEIANDAVLEIIARTAPDGTFSDGLGPHVYRRDRTTPMPRDEEQGSGLLSGRLDELLCWIGPPGDQRAITVSSKPVRTDDGMHLGTVIATSDVTELADALQVREEFLASVSHGLRTPLTSVLGYLDLIEDEVGDAVEVASSFRVVRRNLDELMRKVGDLLSAAQSDIPLVRTETDLARIVTDSVGAVRATADGLAVQLSSQARDPLIIVGDPLRLRQAVDHLVANAVKFTPAGGLVNVSLVGDGDHAVLAVWDTGMGVSVDDRRQIFDRFYRAREARVRAIPGLGLGLAIVKAIVTAHQGSIDVTSEPGEGSLFAVRLPLRATTAPVRATPDHGVAEAEPVGA